MGLYLRNADYRLLEGVSKISSTVYNFDTFFLACYVHGFCIILSTENHISLDIKILRRSYKSIHGKNLDIGLGNHLNPRESSKCTVFMTGFITSVTLYAVGNA